jgi:zinc protease
VNEYRGRRLRLAHALVLVCVAVLTAACAGTGPRPGTEPVRSVEGIEEYRLDNGLQILLFQDPSRSSITINTTYFVGSRHESYGETGMAHLLEHMLFYGTERHPDIKGEISARGGRANGTTWYDRTNYFQTFPARSENLEWAVSVEADRMTNAAFTAEDLASEMTVVRNEFEIGENQPFRVLLQRVMSAAYQWHGYGRSTIGARSDIENVPIERLHDFYRRYYLADNAVVGISGNIDRDQALGLVERHFGRIPRPHRQRELRIWDTYTREPAQDGEREVTLRRVGDTQVVMAVFHVPAGAHEDTAAIDLLAHVLGNSPGGRLYQALVEPGLATNVGAFGFQLREPGVLLAFAQVPLEQDLGEVREIFLATLEEASRREVSEQETRRARNERLRSLELSLNDSERIGIGLSEWAASGDWRLIFLHRDRLHETGAEDVGRVAGQYLKRSNRTFGQFIPEPQPERATIPEVEDLATKLAAYEQVGSDRAAGEGFEATPANIHERLDVRQLSNGMTVAMLPKSTRGNRVTGNFVLRLGTEDSLRGHRVPGNLVPAMLMRGTSERDRQTLQDEINELQASVSVYGNVTRGIARIETRREQLDDVLGLVAEVLRRPAFNRHEFEELRRQRLESLREALSQPNDRAFSRLSEEFSGVDRHHPEYAASLEEEIEALQEIQLRRLTSFHERFYGADSASVVLIGDFDPDAVHARLEGLLGDWTASVPYERIPADSHDPGGQNIVIRTPDRANAALGAGLRLPLGERDDDYPAMLIANYMLGGGFLSSRLPNRIRNVEGLSYGIGTGFNASSFESSGQFTVYAFFAPENRDRLLEVMREELDRLLDEGFTAEELDGARQGWLQGREVSRGNDPELLTLINNNLAVGRDVLWEQALEDAVMALDVKTVNAVVRKHLDPGRLTVITAGDFGDND